MYMYVSYSTSTKHPVLTGLDVDGVEGRTPLHLVSMGRHILCVEMLCQMNATINVRDSSGASPIDVAKEKGFGDVFEMLHIASGGNISQ
jgi:ankyrin repeat protein